MDRKSILVLAACLGLLLLWQPLVVNKIYPPKPMPKGTNAPAAALTATNLPAESNAPAPAPAPALAEAPVTAPQPVAATNVAEELVEITNAVAHYTFTSHGGGLKLVELLRYRDEVPRRGAKTLDTNHVATLNGSAPAPVLAVLGGEAVQGDGIFNLARTEQGVRAEKALTNGLVIVKEFEPTSNYLVRATVRLENRSTQPLAIPPQEWVSGTATPMNLEDDGSVVGVLWYNGAKSQDVSAGFFSSKGFACMPRVPPSEYRNGQTNVLWVAAHNQFFALATMAQEQAVQVVARKIDLPPPTPEDLVRHPRAVPQPLGFQTAMVYPATTLAPGQTVQRQFLVFAGPKEYRTLAAVAGSLNNNVDLVMGFGGFFGFFSKGLLLGMNGLHSALGLSYGWTIIAITIIIKVLFWPLTQASTRSMKRMQALQPQMAAIKEKYKDDPAKMNKKTMEFMKEHKVSPLGGCLPMLLQMPVFIGFFYMIRSAIELRGESFLWVRDLSRPDTLFLIPGANFPFNLLPLIMGATMLWQARLTPPSPGMDPTQAKMMRYMPVIFLVFLYNFSAGLTLYWTVQNLLTIAQTKLTKMAPQTAPGQPKGSVLTPPLKKKK